MWLSGRCDDDAEDGGVRWVLRCEWPDLGLDQVLDRSVLVE